MDFVLGNTDPPVTRDRGAGAWNSVPTTIEMRLKRSAIFDILPSAAIIVGDDAAKHMMHYLMKTGTDYTIDFEDMVDEVPLTRKYLGVEIDLAKAFVETLPPGVHSFTSSRIMPNLYATKAESYNWYFAIGGYSAWGKGIATVAGQVGGLRNYKMAFEYKFFDRYNWDGGKKVTLFGIEITDEFMARFHREGLAREFDCWGAVYRTVSWTSGTPARPGAATGRAGPLAAAGAKGGAGKLGAAGKTTYTVRPGDSLSKIAGVYYGNIHLWPKIYQANKAVVGSNPNLIRPGQNLVIP